MGKGTGEQEVEDMLSQLGEQYNGRINYLTFVKFWRQIVLQMSLSPKQQLQNAVKKTVTMLRAVRTLSSDHHNALPPINPPMNPPPSNDPLSLSYSRMPSFGTTESDTRCTWRTVEDVVVDGQDGHNHSLPYTSSSMNVVNETSVLEAVGADTQPIKLRRVSTMTIDGE